MPFYSQNCHFLELPFYFPEVPFCFQKCLFLKNALLFSRIVLLFSRSASLHDSLENAVFEHLEWLKHQKFARGSTLKLLQGGLQRLSDLPTVSPGC